VTTGNVRITLADLRGNARRRRKEQRMKATFFAAAGVSVVIGGLILFVLTRGAIQFLSQIDFGQLKDSGWFPRRDRFDLTTLVVASVIMGLIAMIVAVPVGLGTAIYLSEYAKPRVRSVIKPIIEVLAGIPSVVVGYFALRFIQPEIVERLFDPRSNKSMLAGGLGIGILVIPIMASISEDALRAVPHPLREASYGVGARKSTTTAKIVLPAAVSGLVAAFVIAVSRAIGETMVATMAGGPDGSGPFSRNPLEGGLTLTAAMTNAAGGTDQAVKGASFNALFFLGLVLFLLTMVLNLIGDRFVQRVRMKY